MWGTRGTGNTQLFSPHWCPPVYAIDWNANALLGISSTGTCLSLCSASGTFTYLNAQQSSSAWQVVFGSGGGGFQAECLAFGCCRSTVLRPGAPPRTGAGQTYILTGGKCAWAWGKGLRFKAKGTRNAFSFFKEAICHARFKEEVSLTPRCACQIQCIRGQDHNMIVLAEGRRRKEGNRLLKLSLLDEQAWYQLTEQC